MTVLLGIDLGDRRIGVATADTDTGSVRPLLTLRRGTPAADAATLRRISRERRVDELVVGLPLHRDGRESEQSRRTRAWVEEVGSLVGLPVTLRDERLTSQSAEGRMGLAPRGRSGGAPSARARHAWRARIDREAAADILQRELDARTTSEVTT
ncbi:MAG: Holliday junction resolvase RuvX [Candidatus Limnocylindrales bacterium]